MKIREDTAAVLRKHAFRSRLKLVEMLAVVVQAWDSLSESERNRHIASRPSKAAPARTRRSA